MTNGNGGKAPNGSQSDGETAPAPEPAQTPARFCQEHRAEFKRYSRGENVWSSHKPPDAKWCREK